MLQGLSRGRREPTPRHIQLLEHIEACQTFEIPQGVFMKIQVPEALHVGEADQARPLDAVFPQSEPLQQLKRGQRLESSIGDGIATQLEPLKLVEATQHPQAPIAQSVVRQSENTEFAKCREGLKHFFMAAEIHLEDTLRDGVRGPTRGQATALNGQFHQTRETFRFHKRQDAARVHALQPER